jgi:heme iron utilization protein
MLGSLDRLQKEHAMSDENAQQARDLMRSQRKGGLGTLDRATGSPFVSMVSFALDVDGSPVLLLSALAKHTANLAADSRASLLLDSTNATGDPTTGGRLTLTGGFEKTDRPTARKRFLARHPDATAYVDFGDFDLWRLDVAQGHFIGGFGRIVALDRSQLGIAKPGT